MVDSVNPTVDSAILAAEAASANLKVALAVIIAASATPVAEAASAIPVAEAASVETRADSEEDLVVATIRPLCTSAISRPMSLRTRL